MFVRIYQPAKTAMQSGRAKTHSWVLAAVSGAQKTPEDLMGWISSDDTLAEINLSFTTQEAAIAYAEENAWEYTVLESHAKKVRPKNYAANFAFERIR